MDDCVFQGTVPFPNKAIRGNTCTSAPLQYVSQPQYHGPRGSIFVHLSQFPPLLRHQHVHGQPMGAPSKRGASGAVVRRVALHLRQVSLLSAICHVARGNRPDATRIGRPTRGLRYPVLPLLTTNTPQTRTLLQRPVPSLHHLLHRYVREDQFINACCSRDWDRTTKVIVRYNFALKGDFVPSRSLTQELG